MTFEHFQQFVLDSFKLLGQAHYEGSNYGRTKNIVDIISSYCFRSPMISPHLQVFCFFASDYLLIKIKTHFYVQSFYFTFSKNSNLNL